MRSTIYNSLIIRTLLISTILAVALACSDSSVDQQVDESSIQPQPSKISATPVIAMDSADVNGYMHALFTGPLVLEGSCLYLGAGPEQGGTTPVFPFGSAVLDDEALVFDGQRIEPGDEISFGGGQRDYSNATNLSQYPAPECQTDNGLWIVSPNLVEISKPKIELPTVQPNSNPSDIEALARDYQAAIGLDYDEALRRARLLLKSDETVAALRESAGGTYAGLAIEHEPDLVIQLRLTSPPSIELRSVINNSPIPVILEFTPKLSISESRERISAVDIEVAILGIQGFSFDERTGELAIDVYIAEGPEKEKDLNEVAVAQYLLSEKLGFPVRIDFQSGPSRLFGSN